MVERPRVLFLCTGNSCRSQIAEGFLRHLAGERFDALSAGVDPQGLNPGAVATMAEVGVDITDQTSDDIQDYLASPPDLVVTVCGHAAERCPVFPGATRVVHWPFEDPAHATGSVDEVREVFASVRDTIHATLTRWLDAGAPLDIETTP